MNDAALMRVLESLSDLPGNGQGFVEGESAFADPLGKSLALDEFQHQRMDAGGVLEAIDGGDMGMIKGCQQLGFAFESGDTLWIGRDGLGQNLEGDFPPKTSVAGAIHFTHSAEAENAAYVVRADFCTSGDGHEAAGL
jgi:hypothetical protein